MRVSGTCDAVHWNGRMSIGRYVFVFWYVCLSVCASVHVCMFICVFSCLWFYVFVFMCLCFCVWVLGCLGGFMRLCDCICAFVCLRASLPSHGAWLSSRYSLQRHWHYRISKKSEEVRLCNPSIKTIKIPLILLWLEYFFYRKKRNAGQSPACLFPLFAHLSKTPLRQITACALSRPGPLTSARCWLRSGLSLPACIQSSHRSEGTATTGTGLT